MQRFVAGSLVAIVPFFPFFAYRQISTPPAQFQRNFTEAPSHQHLPSLPPAGTRFSTGTSMFRSCVLGSFEMFRFLVMVYEPTQRPPPQSLPTSAGQPDCGVPAVSLSASEHPCSEEQFSSMCVFVGSGLKCPSKRRQDKCKQSMNKTWRRTSISEMCYSALKKSCKSSPPKLRALRTKTNIRRQRNPDLATRLILGRCGHLGCA